MDLSQKKSCVSDSDDENDNENQLNDNCNNNVIDNDDEDEELNENEIDDENDDDESGEDDNDDEVIDLRLKDYAESSMKELLGLYGFNQRDSRLSIKGASNSVANPTGKCK